MINTFLNKNMFYISIIRLPSKMPLKSILDMLKFVFFLLTIIIPLAILALVSSVSTSGEINS